MTSQPTTPSLNRANQPHFIRFRLPKNATEQELTEFLKNAIRQVLANQDPCEQPVATNGSEA